MSDPQPDEFTEENNADISWATFPVTSGGIITIDSIDHSEEEPIPMVEAPETDTSNPRYR